MPDQCRAGKAREILAQTLLEYSKKRYKERGNPYYAIVAYKISRDIGIELPDWIESYVFGTFDELAKLYTDDPLSGKSRVDPTAQSIKKALGLSMRGRGTLVTAAKKHERDIRFAEAVEIQLRQWFKLDFAYDAAVDYFAAVDPDGSMFNNASRSQVARAYSEFKDIIDPIT